MCEWGRAANYGCRVALVVNSIRSWVERVPGTNFGYAGFFQGRRFPGSVRGMMPADEDGDVVQAFFVEDFISVFRAELCCVSGEDGEPDDVYVFFAGRARGGESLRPSWLRPVRSLPCRRPRGRGDDFCAAVVANQPGFASSL